MKQQHTSSFLSEMTLLSKIHHPSIISLYEVFLSHGNYYVVMEYCKGGSIVDIISKIRRKSEAIVVNIMQQLLSALSYLHANNIVHRDIKLENIVFLDNVSEGQNEFIPIKIIDFGSAVQTKYKIVQNYPIAGTLPYLAPEVLKGLLSERSDIWSSGVLMIILLTGVSPFKGKNEA
jgi:calcium-dependent protein kinase